MSITISTAAQRLQRDIGVEPDGDHASILPALLSEAAVAMFADCPWLRLQSDGSLLSVPTAAVMQAADTISMNDVEEEPLRSWAAAKFFGGEAGDRNDLERAMKYAAAYVRQTGGTSPIGG